MSATENLTCQELVELVTEYLEEALAPAERQRFEAHLADCAGCRTYLEQMRQTIQATGALREEDLEPATRDQLLNIFRSWKQEG